MSDVSVTSKITILSVIFNFTDEVEFELTDAGKRVWNDHIKEKISKSSSHYYMRQTIEEEAKGYPTRMKLWLFGLYFGPHTNGGTIELIKNNKLTIVLTVTA